MKDVFQANFGGRLKAAREAKNLAPADVASKLKLTARQVEALEQEDFGHLPSEVFVRGFVRNYARLVGIDPESLIAPVDVQAEVSETITAPNAGLNVGSNGIRLWLVYPVIALVFFVLLVAILYYWLRQGEDALIASPSEVVSQILPPTETVPPPPGFAPHSEAAGPAPAVINSAPDSSPQVATPNTPSDSSTSPSTQPAPAEEATLPAAVADTNTGVRNMRFEPATDAWIQVVDGQGARFSKLVRAGAAESFAGTPPFRLVVGEAALVKLTYNGHSIDLTPFIGQKVARLTLE
jgi:cytoskeleton protein RodZ